MTGTGPLRAPGGSFHANVRGLDVMYGWNADDMSAFPQAAGDSGDVAERTRHMYETPLADLRARLLRAGARVHAYRLDWRPSVSTFGATHCVELPLLLGCESAWQSAPMLGDLAWSDIDAVGGAVRAAWISFARTGAPGPMPDPLVHLTP
ncbi:hypothetical protein ACWEO2_03325 [Nocardia sp. NPDC004278]